MTTLCDSVSFEKLCPFQRVKVLSNVSCSKQEVPANLLSFTNSWFSAYRHRIREVPFPALETLSERGQELYWLIRGACSLETLATLCFAIDTPSKEAAVLIEILEDFFASLFCDLAREEVTVSGDLALLAEREENAALIDYARDLIAWTRRLEPQRMKGVTEGVMNLLVNKK